MRIGSVVVYKIALLICMLGISQSMASVVITGTRVIYPASEKEVTVQVNNRGRSPVLIQAWIDNGNADERPETIKVPFIITPPMNRIDVGKGQTLRITFTGTRALSTDRESAFWLNVLEVPPLNPTMVDVNKLQVAFRSRIKLFYRPAGIIGDTTRAAENLQWDVSNGKLTAINNSPYYISLLGVSSVTAHGEADMVPPYGRADITGKKAYFKSSNEIVYQYINDWGAIRSVKKLI